MDDAALLVKIFKRLGNLDDDVSREVFAKVGKADDLVEEFTTGGELEDNVVVGLGLGKIDELDDVGMIKLLHNLDLFENIRALAVWLALVRAWNKITNVCHQGSGMDCMVILGEKCEKLCEPRRLSVLS